MKNDTAGPENGEKKPAGQAVNAVSYAASVSSVDQLTGITRQRRASDASIKELIRNARFTGALLSVMLEDIRLDLVFEYAADTGLMLRIDEEPQTSQKAFSEESSESYSLTARAVYYAALAMVTQLQSGEEYHKIRKVYSVWLCYKRPVPEMDEPVIRYSLRPDEEYAYRDGIPLKKCKRKFDSGDLMGIVLVSVPDVERIYKDSGLLHSGKYNEEMITVLYHLLAEGTGSEQRKKFYYDRGIIVSGSEEVSSVSGNEELRILNEEIRIENEKMRIHNEEMRIEAEELRGKIVELEKKIAELETKQKSAL